MLTILRTFILLFVPAAISLILDRILTKSNRNTVSKYVFYLALDNIGLMSITSLTYMADFTPWGIGSSNSIFLIFFSIALAVSLLFPIVIALRLPKALASALNYVLSHPVAVISLGVGITAALFLPIILDNKRNEVFTCYNILVRLFSAFVLSLFAIIAYRILKDAKSKGFKQVFADIGKRLSEDDSKQFKTKLLKALLVNVAFSFSVMMFVPFETYLGNTSEFVFGFSSFGYIVAVEFFIYVCLLTMVQLLFKGKGFDIAVSVVFGLTIAAYAQSMFLNGSMQLMTGGDAESNLTSGLINLAIWVLIFAAPIVLASVGVKFLKPVITFGCILIIGMQSVALISLLATVEQPIVKTRLTEKGLYDVAEKDNVIVFVLDCFDQDNIDKMLAEDPTALDGLKGFTCYDNMTGSYCYTHVAIPHLLSGEYIAEYNPSDKQFEESLRNSRYFNGLTDNLSSVGIYTEDIRVVGEESRSKITNIASSENSTLDLASVMVTSQKISLYRILPWCFKSTFSYTADDYNWAVEASSDGDKYYNSSPYTDAAMHRNIKGYGLSVNKEYTNGCYRFIHTSGAHEPFRLDRNCNFAGRQNVVESSLGSIKLVTEYIKELERLGVYKDATIIITSDHGTCKPHRIEENAEVSINPVMIYKPSGVGYDEPMKRSTAPISHEDIFPTVMNAFGLEYETERGMIIEDVTEDTERTRYYYWCRREPDLPDSGWAYIHLEYAINGDSRDEESWTATGNFTHCNGWAEAMGYE